MPILYHIDRHVIKDLFPGKCPVLLQGKKVRCSRAPLPPAVGLRRVCKQSVSGSNPWSLNRHCPCWMLRGMGGTLFKNILVPVDFSACSTEAFQVAWQLAAALGARITVMHVIDVNAVEAFNRLGLLAVPSDAARQRKRLHHHARLKTRELLESHPHRQSIRRVVVEGTPFVEIAKFARKEEIDLVVLGSYGGRTDSMEKIFFGATADRVVRTAGCAVLTVPLLRQKRKKDITL